MKSSGYRWLNPWRVIEALLRLSLICFHEEPLWYEYCILGIFRITNTVLLNLPLYNINKILYRCVINKGSTGCYRIVFTPQNLQMKCFVALTHYKIIWDKSLETDIDLKDDVSMNLHVAIASILDKCRTNFVSLRDDISYKDERNN